MVFHGRWSPLLLRKRRTRRSKWLGKQKDQCMPRNENARKRKKKANRKNQEGMRWRKGDKNVSACLGDGADFLLSDPSSASPSSSSSSPLPPPCLPEYSHRHHPLLRLPPPLWVMLCLSHSCLSFSPSGLFFVFPKEESWSRGKERPHLQEERKLEAETANASACEWVRECSRGQIELFILEQCKRERNKNKPSMCPKQERTDVLLDLTE